MLVLVLAQQSIPTSPADPSLWEQFGPFAICFILLGMFIVWREVTVHRERKEEREGWEAEKIALVAEVQAGLKREREQSAQLVSTVQELAPALTGVHKELERSTDIVARATHALDRMDSR